MTDKLTGGKVNYYLVKVDHPQRENQPAYQAECEDIIRALGMTFDEGCEFKALWRTAAARQGNGKPGREQQDQAIYDAEKRVHYAQACLRQYKQDAGVKKAEFTLWHGHLHQPDGLYGDTQVEVITRSNVHSTGLARHFSWYHSTTHRNDDIVMFRKV